MPNQKAEYVWQMEDALGPIAVDPEIPSVPTLPPIVPSVYHANGNRGAFGAAIIGPAEGAFGDQSLRLTPSPPDPYNLAHPAAGRYLLLSHPFVTYDGYSIDFRVRFNDSGHDASLSHELRVKDSGGTTHWLLRISRYAVSVGYISPFFGFQTAYSGFSDPLAAGTWHSIRMSLFTSLLPGYVVAFVNGTKEIISIPSGFGISLAPSVYFEHTANRSTGATGTVDIDKLGLICRPQMRDFSPATSADFFTFTYASTPEIQFAVSELRFEISQAMSYALLVTGGIGPYTFVIVEGSLPPGMVLSETGVLSGIPIGVGSYNVRVKAVDSNSEEGYANLPIVVFLEAYSKYRFGAGTLGLIPNNDPNEPRDVIGNINGNEVVSQTILLEAEALAESIGHSSEGGTLKVYASN